jgi:hypothetical protein
MPRIRPAYVTLPTILETSISLLALANEVPPKQQQKKRIDANDIITFLTYRETTSIIPGKLKI